MCHRTLFWAICVCAAQFLDGFLTYCGMTKFGIAAEGNALVRFLMDYMGVAEALITVKLFSVYVVVFLCLRDVSQNFLRIAFKSISIFYFVFAICPWTLMFLMG
jgi:uncharacterized membrane protein